MAIAITPHFTEAEVLKDSGAKQIPTQLLNGIRAQAQVLEAVRTTIGGKPVTVTSWYRTPEKNAKTPGSSPRSPHMVGRGTDIKVSGMTPRQVMTALNNVGLQGLGIDQAIEYATHVHIGTREGSARGQALIRDITTETGYSPWKPDGKAPVGTEESTAKGAAKAMGWIAVAAAAVEVLSKLLEAFKGIR